MRRRELALGAELAVRLPGAPPAIKGTHERAQLARTAGGQLIKEKTGPRCASEVVPRTPRTPLNLYEMLPPPDGEDGQGERASNCPAGVDFLGCWCF